MGAVDNVINQVVCSPSTIPYESGVRDAGAVAGGLSLNEVAIEMTGATTLCEQGDRYSCGMEFALLTEFQNRFSASCSPIHLYDYLKLVDPDSEAAQYFYAARRHWEGLAQVLVSP